MLIDWFTVCAQVINFLILVWLMKRFLYRPILSAIETREKNIAIEVAAADAKKAESQREHEEFQRKNAAFDGQREAMMTKATDEAKVERGRLLDEAGKAADELTSKRAAALLVDAESIERSLGRRACEEVFAVARKTLADLANVSLEERMSEVFAGQLREIAPETKLTIGEALRTSDVPSLIKSTFPLAERERAAIQTALNETFSAPVDLRFETSPDLISGIEFSVNGQKIAWSIEEYLSSLQKGVDDLIIAKAPERKEDAELAAGRK